MALYDETFELYDMLVPGSQLVPFFNGKTGDDVMDALGIGTQRRAQEFNSAEAVKQREWQERLANTQYQRAVEDIKAAGLNPSMLYASGGSGNAVPSGASASSGIQGATNIIGQAGILINSLSNAKSLEQKTTNDIYHSIAKIIKNMV